MSVRCRSKRQGSPARRRQPEKGGSGFSGDILIGNFGNGEINAFASDGKFLDTIKGSDGNRLVINGLWTLTLGGGAKSSPDTLYFTAGPNGQTDGVFGTITPASDQDKSAAAD